MNDSENEIISLGTNEEEIINFNDLENKLEEELNNHMEDLKILQDDYDKIENPNSIGEVVGNVVWEQFINQIGTYAGEDFKKENGGLPLNLTNDAHIQTPENFAKGKLAIHNHYSADKLVENYDRYKNTPHKEYRKKYVDPGMDKNLQRAGDLKSQGIDFVKDIYTGRLIPTETKLEGGGNNPKAAQREHVISSAKIYENPSLQMANSNEELAEVTNDPENLQGYTTAERNIRKSDKSSNEMEDKDKTVHWKKANEKAKKYIKGKEEEGEERLCKEGRQTQKEEAMRIGGKALRAVLMGLLADLVKDVIRELIIWFRSAEKNIRTFFDSLKQSIKDFFANFKKYLKSSFKTTIDVIMTAIYGPIVKTINKAIIFLKQGYKSFKEAIKYLKDPAHKGEPLSIKLLQVGKIVTAGVAAGGAILLSEVIEKALVNTIPVFAFEIPMLGSLASILGIFFGALVSGIIGALVLRMLDKAIATKQRQINRGQKIDKGNKILQILDRYEVVANINTEEVKNNSYNEITSRHEEYKKIVSHSLENIKKDEEDNLNKQEENKKELDNINNILNDF